MADETGFLGALDEAARLEVAQERATVQKHVDSKACCIRCIVELAQRIEKRWDDEALRLALLEVFRETLVDLANSRHVELRWMAGLGQKMKTLRFSIDHFLGIVLPLEREHTRGLQDHEFLSSLITTADAELTDAQRLSARLFPWHVVVDNLRSAFNVGSIFRTADCLGASKLHLCGYTATPSDQHVQKTTMGAHAFVEWTWSRKVLEVIEQLKREGIPSIALETVQGAPMCYDFAFPSPCALVLGNERHGIGPDVLAACVATVQLPCIGVKNSMNVGVAFGMCAHEMVRQWEFGRRAKRGEDQMQSASGEQCARQDTLLSTPRDAQDGEGLESPRPEADLGT